MKRLTIMLSIVTLMAMSSVAQSVSEPRNYEIEKSYTDGPFVEIINRQDDSGLININKETGEIWMIWGSEAYPVTVAPSPNNVVNKGTINFQIITRKDANYLLNLNTGETWILREKMFSHKNSHFDIVVRKE